MILTATDERTRQILAMPAYSTDASGLTADDIRDIAKRLLELDDNKEVVPKVFRVRYTALGRCDDPNPFQPVVYWELDMHNADENDIPAMVRQSGAPVFDGEECVIEYEFLGR